ncbi:MAG TPA: Stp1/IreP family PP2C-type Ser/Thr phosphatase [Longimicrobiales bacterium]|nr:Stp1/IreP family PP2C-type Ser/Thr phosphatase [Longimicrobiales bacterium]
MTTPLDIVAATHCGRRRAHNEDCVAADETLGLAVLADGMGGHNAGEVASSMAVDVITSGIHAAIKEGAMQRLHKAAESLIAEHVSQANERIYEAARRHPEFAGMGTTVLVALWHDGSVSVGHVGDSRMYRLRAHSLEQLTHDHSLAQDQIDRGLLTPEAARTAPIRNVLTRTVGNAAEVHAELKTFRAAADDVYLLCSDGLTDMLTDEQITDALISFGARIQHAADELVKRANEHGGLDNISVILVRVMQGAELGGAQ